MWKLMEGPNGSQDGDQELKLSCILQLEVRMRRTLLHFDHVQYVEARTSIWIHSTEAVPL